MTPRHYGPWWHGALAGLLATFAGLAAAEVVVGVIRGSASPVVPVGQVVIDSVPTAVKDWAIETFGTADKVVLVAGALSIILGLGVLVGMLMQRGTRAVAMALTAVIGLVGALAVMIRPSPSTGKLMPTLVGTAVSLAVLWWLGTKMRRAAPSAAAPESAPPAPDAAVAAPESGLVAPGAAVAAPPVPAVPAVPAVRMGPDRRRFLTTAAAVGSAAVVAGGLGRIMQRRHEIADERATLALPVANSSAPSLPADASLGVPGIEPFVVPIDDFYRIDTALVVPQVRRDSWTLKISGLVDREMELTFDDLLAMPQVERYITLSCVSNPVGGDLVGNARWQGVLLRPILEEAGLQAGAEQVVSRSIDGWTCGTPTEAVMDGRDAMLAIAMNGEPLPARHGYPVRMVVPGLYGYVSATKWVTDIRLTRWDDFDAYWVPRGWSKTGPVKTMSRIDTPRGGRVDPGVVPIGGVAWAVHRGISAVQVRIDEGEWRDAELGGVPSSDTWVQWVYRWETEPGTHVVQVRALDGDGVPQLEEPAPVAPDGAQGHHRITLAVDG